MEYVFLGLLIFIAWLISHISSQISLQINIISEATLQLREALKKEESTDYKGFVKYDANDIYKLLEDYPEKIAKEIKRELGYSQNDVLALESDIKEIKGYLSDIEKELGDIRIRMPD